MKNNLICSVINILLLFSLFRNIFTDNVLLIQHRKRNIAITILLHFYGVDLNNLQFF